ncbi:MAG: Rpn family recombination-promoting nuclease/putative transposase [Pseudomonadota bacterium]
MYGNNRYLNPTNDISFKKLFGTEDHKNLLISFLNSMLGLKGKRCIQDVKLIPQELSPLFGDGKRSILDVQCTDATGTHYIVEMQNDYTPDFVKRTQMYTSHTYVSQLGKGTKQIELSPVILLAITNYTVFPKKKQPISYHKMLDVETLENDLTDISYVFIDLSKFHKKDANELETLVDKWMYFFKYWEKSKSPPKTITEPELIEAYDTMEKFNWDATELNVYLKADIAFAEQQKSKEEEHQKGLKEGREEGRKEEHTKSKKQIREIKQKSEREKIEIMQKAEKEKFEIMQKAKQDKINMLQELLRQGVQITTIKKATGLNQSEIEKILRSINHHELSA